MNVDALLKKMEDVGMNKDRLSNEISMDRATLYRKLARKGEPFTIGEAKKIARALNLSAKEASSIFFNT